MEDEFSSGPWTGFYTYQNNCRDRMDLTLTFKQGVVSGSGSDPVGFFMIQGGYDGETNEVRWTKSYPGRHDVAYKGCRDARGIWGTWEIRTLGIFTFRGGFHIWQEAHGGGAMEHAQAVIDLQVVAVAPPLQARRP